MKVSEPKEKGSSFYLGFLFLSKPRREALNAVYAYCRHIDDIVDSGELTAEAARHELGFWHDELDRLFGGRPAHPVALRLAPHVRGFGLVKEPFLEILKGCEMDLGQVRYESFPELQTYMARVASAVGLIAVEIFGHQATPPDRLREFAMDFGYAFQLTNIIRDVGADLDKGRVYLPSSDMKEAGYPLESLLRRERGDAFRYLMELQYNRAKTFYRKARANLAPGDRRSMLPAEIMAHIYEGLLEDIRASGFDVLGAPRSQGLLSKTGRAFKALLYCRGLSGA
ncbi:MAG: squalene/phytoene synthase family protein [Elusimicrobia bacterium]|nr:squalene/phytoene synthase family protein [Elusimicrobiota bacterium]